MDITVYLPDALGKRAKEANLPFSQLLRAAVEDELERIETMGAALEDATEIGLHVEDDDGYYAASFTGVKLGEVGEVSVYLTDDKRVVLYDEALLNYQVFEDTEDPQLEASIRASFGPGRHARADYLELMNKLGIKPKIDI